MNTIYRRFTLKLHASRIGMMFSVLASPVLHAQGYTYSNGENYSGTFDTVSEVTFLSAPAETSATQSGAISGTGNIIVNNDPVHTGTLTFTGSSAYTGDTQVAHGTLTVSGPNGAIVNGTASMVNTYMFVSGSSSIAIGNANPTGDASMTVSNGGSVVTAFGRIGRTVALYNDPLNAPTGISYLTVDGAGSS